MNAADLLWAAGFAALWAGAVGYVLGREAEARAQRRAEAEFQAELRRVKAGGAK